jgi:hypothetical protein
MGASLELIGGLSPEPEYEQTTDASRSSSQVVGDVPPSTIYAVSDSGEKISIWGAERGSFKAGFGGEIQEEFWQAGWVCIGAHVVAVDTPILHGFTVALDNLYYLAGDGRFCPPQWVHIEGVERPGEKQDDGTFLVPYILPVIGGHRSGYVSASTENTTYMVDTYATHPWISPATEAMPALKLDFMTNRRRSGPIIELSVDTFTRIDAVGNSERSAKELLNSMKPLLDLISLATFDTPGVEWMRAQTVNDEEVSLLCRLEFKGKPDLPFAYGDLVFTLDDVSFGDFLATWQRLARAKQSRYAWNAAMGVINHSPLMVEGHISQVLAAAEGFHKWCLGHRKKGELEARLRQLYDSLPSSLKERLQLDVDRWADWAAWARNHIDHGGSHQYREISDFYQLKIIADSVRLIMYLAVLKEFTVPNNKLEEALSNHARLKVLAERCAQVSSLPAPSDARMSNESQHDRMPPNSGT